MSCDGTHVYNCIDCVDAWDLEKYYSGPEAPTPITSFDNVEVGDFVEFNHGAERLWGEIVELCYCPADCDLLVEVTTPPIKPHPFIQGDVIKINIIHIYNHRKKL